MCLRRHSQSGITGHPAAKARFISHAKSYIARQVFLSSDTRPRLIFFRVEHPAPGDVGKDIDPGSNRLTFHPGMDFEARRG